MSKISRDIFAQISMKEERLRCFSEPFDVFLFLNKLVFSNNQMRSNVTSALISSAQRGESQLALKILLLAFFPSLCKVIDSSWYKPGFGRENLIALVFESFIDQVFDFDLERLSRFAVINLIYGMKKVVWRTIRIDKEIRGKEVQLDHSFEQCLASGDPSPEAWSILHQESLTKHLKIKMYLNRLLLDESEENVCFALEMYALEGSLMGWVRARNPSLDRAALMREYSRVRHRRARLLKRLKKASERVPFLEEFSSTSIRPPSVRRTRNAGEWE